jgi:hypothetical protein
VAIRAAASLVVMPPVPHWPPPLATELSRSSSPRSRTSSIGSALLSVRGSPE